jgi:DNA repair exonuclease SbcCD nuclease subunit
MSIRTNQVIMKITKNEVAIVGDVHLGLHQASNIWHDISENYARWLKQTLIDRNIKDIIFLGDILDNRNEVSVTTLHVLQKFFKILEDFNIILVIGNHDCYYSKRSDIHSLGTLNDWSNIEVVDKVTTVNLFNQTLTFCPWNTQLSDIPKSDILFGHFEINTFKMNGGHVCESGYNSQELLDRSSLIMSGHFHKTDIRSYKTGKIVYVGSAYENNWGEYGDPKGFYILNLHDNALEFVTNTLSPRHIKIRLSELLAVGKITDSIKKEFKGNIIDFIIDMETDQKVIDTLLSKFYALSPIAVKTENELVSKPITTIEEEIEFTGIDIKTDIVEFVNGLEGIDNKDAIISYLMNVHDKCKEEKV